MPIGAEIFFRIFKNLANIFSAFLVLRSLLVILIPLPTNPKPLVRALASLRGSNLESKAKWSFCTFVEFLWPNFFVF